MMVELVYLPLRLLNSIDRNSIEAATLFICSLCLAKPTALSADFVVSKEVTESALLIGLRAMSYERVLKYGEGK